MKFFDQIKETMFPNNYTCDICGVETFGTNICAACAKKTPQNCDVTCPVCGRRTVRPEICIECKDEAPPFKKGVSALVYEDNVCILISKFKNGKGYLKEYFADLLADKVAVFPACDCIVYVPMSKKSVRKRGYNQGKLLADALSKRIGVPVENNALIKVKDSQAQKSLSKKERFENISGCFKVADKEKIKGKTILLVDDVMTTGATAFEITKKLLRAGANAVYFAAVASVEYKILKTENASDL